LRLAEAEAPFALAGGLAVSAWAERLLTPAEKEGLGVPLQSKDLDVRGTRTTAELLLAAFKESGATPQGFVVARRKESPNMGRVFAFSVCLGNRNTTVEVLERLPLLDQSLDSPPQGSALRLGRISVLDPCSLFICKLHAWNTRPVAHREHDLDHLRVLWHVIPRFLATANELKAKSTGASAYSPRIDAERLRNVLRQAKSPGAKLEVPLPEEQVGELERILDGAAR
jgi:hypothetical protein